MPKIKWHRIKTDLPYSEIHNLVAAARDGQEGADQFMISFLGDDHKLAYLCNLVDLIGMDEELLRSMKHVCIYREIPVVKT